VDEPLSKDELEAAHCWEASDRIPGRPEMTEFRRRIRYRQARWREANGHPIGTQPIAPKPGQQARPVGSRLPLEYARETGANFITDGALEAVRSRTSVVEPNQSLDHQRVWADLLWSPAMAFNLFGDLAVDLDLADRAVHTWWPDAPGTVSKVRFTHSPGWLDPSFTNNLRGFDAAVALDLGDGTDGIVAVGVKYHDWTKPEIPKPENLARYLEVARRSRAFRPRATGGLKGRSGLAVMWLEHLLLLSMLQHPSGRWSWGRYVVVHLEGNVDFVEACARYRGLLADETTFASMTIEELLDAGALPTSTAATLRDRYV
jgi:PD-(D/E)XK nuclease superfamily protein